MALLNHIARNISNRPQVTTALRFINERLERELSQYLTPCRRRWKGCSR
jgi:hypothetical protein